MDQRNTNRTRQPNLPGTTTNAQKDFMTAAMLSLFLGMLGIDRFYLGKVGTGILKLITFGGLGIWYLIDLIIILTGSMKSKNGQPLQGRKKHLKLALIITVVWLVICIGLYATNSSENGVGSLTSNTGGSNSKKDTDKLAVIGEPVRDGKFEFTITGFSCGATSVGDNPYLKKTAQGQFCLLNLTVKNISTEAQIFDSSSEYLYASTSKYSADGSASIYVNPQGSTFLNQINPGNSVTGTVVFDVPLGVSPNIADLHDSPYSAGVKVNLN